MFSFLGCRSVANVGYHHSYPDFVYSNPFWCYWTTISCVFLVIFVYKKPYLPSFRSFAPRYSSFWALIVFISSGCFFHCSQNFDVCHFVVHGILRTLPYRYTWKASFLDVVSLSVHVDLAFLMRIFIFCWLFKPSSMMVPR